MRQLVMYPGLANSPQTELSAAINNTVVTIPLVDASKVPAAPNIVTIGTDEAAETILYTGKSGNNLTGVTRGVEGTAKAWSEGSKVARNFTNKDYETLRVNLEDLQGILAPGAWNPVILNNGTQIVQGGDVPAILHPRMVGRTLINLLGRNGNMETVGKWTNFQVTHALDSNNKVYGNNAIKVSIASTFTTGSMYHASPLENGKYYIALAEVKNNDLSVGVALEFGEAGLAITDKTKFNTVWVKRQFTTGHSQNVAIIPTGAAGQSAFVDGVRVFELSKAEYDAIPATKGSVDTSTKWVAEKYPYVDDMKHVNAVYMANPGKNLLPPLIDWGFNTGAYVITDSYKGTVTNNDKFICTIPVTPGQAYCISAISGGATGRLFAVSGSLIIDLSGAGLLKSENIIIPAGQTLMEIRLLGTTASQVEMSNPMLAPSGEVIPFEPQKPSYLYLPDVQLTSNVDGSIRDELYTDGQGKPRVTRRFREMALDGSLVWANSIDFVGYKQITVALTSFPGMTPNATTGFTAIKYDGKILTNSNAQSAGDQVYAGASNLVLQILDTDSGWGETYTPTLAELQAYFSGWRMYNGAVGVETPYNGTGSKWWVDNLGTVVTGGVNSVPTTRATGGYTPYRLMYQLAQSVDEAANYEGALMLHEGANLVEVGTGIVVRESARPLTDTQNYFINATSLPATQLKNRALKILSVYRNGDVDTWVTGGSSPIAYGIDRAYLSNARFDLKAAYSVTYLALDTYAMGIAPLAINADYAPNIRENVSSLVREVVEARTEVSILRNTKVQKQLPQWIAPTLLNGWVNDTGVTADGGNYNPAEFMKDDSGIVHIRDG